MEGIVEAPWAQATRKCVEVLEVQVQEVVRHVRILTTEGHTRHVPRVHVVQVEKIVEVPPTLQTIEKTIEVPELVR